MNEEDLQTIHQLQIACISIFEEVLFEANYEHNHIEFTILLHGDGNTADLNNVDEIIYSGEISPWRENLIPDLLDCFQNKLKKFEEHMNNTLKTCVFINSNEKNVSLIFLNKSNESVGKSDLS